MFVYRSVPVSSQVRIAFPGRVDKCMSARGLLFEAPEQEGGDLDALRIPV